MRKKHLRPTRRTLAGVVLLASLLSVEAQVPDPSAWSSFVNGADNVLVVDTFMRQSFLNQPTDNWEYTTGGGAAIPEGKKSVQIPAGGHLSFAPFPAEGYQEVMIRFRMGGDKLELGEDVTIRYLHNGKMETETFYSPTKYDDYFNYKDIQRPGSSLEIEVSTSAESRLDGYYVVNSFTAFGSIPRYSLFSGNGNWNDTSLWSHLPPFRNRSALVSGNLEVNTPVECRQLMIGNGSVTIGENGDCLVDTLVLCSGNPTASSDISLTATGNLSVNKQLELRYTFPEKGKWYLLSFPADIRLKGIDKRFQLEDDRFTGTGNYLYAQVYDGEKRAQTNKAEGNWAVHAAPASAADIVFEKGKGYLVALDADASDNTLTFSVEADELPNDFGRKASILVHGASSATAGQSHAGWYLCGNPLPSPLPISQLKSNSALDGYIYLYEGNGYKTYPLSGNYVLPPFAAFFVKASADTEIDLTAGIVSSDATRLKTGYALRAASSEPVEQAVHTVLPDAPNAQSYVKGKAVYLTNLPSAGNMQVMDLAGRILYRSSIPAGSSVMPLPLAAGFYIINIETSAYCTQYKCILAH